MNTIETFSRDFSGHHRGRKSERERNKNILISLWIDSVWWIRERGIWEPIWKEDGKFYLSPACKEPALIMRTDRCEFVIIHKEPWWEGAVGFWPCPFVHQLYCHMCRIQTKFQAGASGRPGCKVNWKKLKLPGRSMQDKHLLFLFCF